MGVDIYQNYSQFYRGTEPIKTYGNGGNKKDTLVKYEFNTTDEKGNKIMDKMTREETLQVMKDISSQYGDNVMVEFSGDGMAKLVESRKGSYLARPLSEEEAALKAEKQEEFDRQVVQLEGTYKKVEDKDDAEWKLSKNAQKLLEKLRRNYGNMDFLALTPGADAKALLAGSKKEISVIFSAEELEKMASDEKYEKEYMDRVQGALRMSDEINKKFGFESAFGKNGSNSEITKIGISFNSDGTTSFFAELEKSSASQRERMEKAQEERRTQRKEDAKKAEREKQRQRLEGKADHDMKRTTVQADSVEELLEKIRAVDWDTIRTGNQPEAGRKFDFSI